MSPTPKQHCIEELAHFLVDQQGAKSILLELETRCRTIRDDDRPRFAHEWALLRDAAGLTGYPTYDEALQILTTLLA